MDGEFRFTVYLIDSAVAAGKVAPGTPTCYFCSRIRYQLPGRSRDLTGKVAKIAKVANFFSITLLATLPAGYLSGFPIEGAVTGEFSFRSFLPPLLKTIRGALTKRYESGLNNRMSWSGEDFGVPQGDFVERYESGLNDVPGGGNG
jgi:hypothetical protein